MPDAEWVALVTASDDIDGQLLAGRLAEAGIETFLTKDRSAPGAWLLGGSNAWAPVEISVPRDSVDDARLVLAELAVEGPAAEPTHIGNGGLAHRWWVTAVVLGLVFTGLILAQLAHLSIPCQIPILCEVGN